MQLDWVRRHCLSFAHATETVQWGNDLVFKVAGKIFAVAGLEPGPIWISFKCAPEQFAQLVERPGVVPAPYLARAHWVALQNESVLPAPEVRDLLRQAYDLVVAKLPKKEQAKLLSTRPGDQG